MGRKTKIDWCDASWNPVTGCLHGCKYCYARRIAIRFCSNEHGKDPDGALIPCEGVCTFCSVLDGLEFVGQKMRWNHSKEPYPFGFMPTFHPHRLDEPKRWKKPRNIFVCSMADLFGDWVPDDCIDQVLTACLAAPQHRYLFLTKNPKRYDELKNKGIITGKEENLWLGSTMTGPANPFYSSGFDKTFISIEPILRPFSYAGNAPFAVSWVIVGAETGNRKDKVIPKKEWILEIAERCRALDTPIFMKESLRGIMGEDFRQEFPW